MGPKKSIWSATTTRPRVPRVKDNGRQNQNREARKWSSAFVGGWPRLHQDLATIKTSGSTEAAYDTIIHTILYYEIGLITSMGRETRHSPIDNKARTGCVCYSS